MFTPSNQGLPTNICSKGNSSGKPCGQILVLNLFQGQSEALRKQEVARLSIDKQKTQARTVLLASTDGHHTLNRELDSRERLLSVDGEI